jgi:hypothetical protein
MDFSDYKFQCSKLVSIMSASREVLSATGAKDLDKLQAKQARGITLSPEEEARLTRLITQRENMERGGIILSKACQAYLKSIYLQEVYGYRYRLLGGEGVPEMVRGIKAQGDATLLLSQVDGRPYYKHRGSVENEYLAGRLDVIDEPTLEAATKVIDIKSSYDIVSFYDKPEEPFTKANILQMQGYLSITGKQTAEIAHCLVGYSEETIQEQYRLLFDKMCPDGVETPEFTRKWKKAELDLRFADIPAPDRVFSFIVHRDDDLIDSIHETVQACRDWLNAYHETHVSYTAKRYLNE